MQEAVKTLIIYVAADPIDGEYRKEIFIRTREGRLMTQRILASAKKRQIENVPDSLMDEVLDLYNKAVDDAGLPDWQKIGQCEWPESAFDKQVILDQLLSHRKNLITIRKYNERLAEELKKSKEREASLITIINTQKDAFSDLAFKYEEMEVEYEANRVHKEIIKQRMAKGA